MTRKSADNLPPEAPTLPAGLVLCPLFFVLFCSKVGPHPAFFPGRCGFSTHPPRRATSRLPPFLCWGGDAKVAASKGRTMLRSTPRIAQRPGAKHATWLELCAGGGECRDRVQTRVETGVETVVN